MDYCVADRPRTPQGVRPERAYCGRRPDKRSARPTTPAWPFPLAAVALFVLFMAAAGSAARGLGHWHAAWAFWSFWWLIPIGIFTARRWLTGGRPPGSR